MTDKHDIASALSSGAIGRTELKSFADFISKFEAESGFKPKRTLINGIPPFKDVATVEFEIPKQRLGKAIETLLGNARINPNIIVNGIPSVDHFNVHVNFGGR